MSFQSEEQETPVVEKFHFLKRKEVNIDIEGLIGYVQTPDRGNKDVEPAKAIGVHVRGYFQYTAPTTPPHLALTNFHSLTDYFMHLIRLQ